MLSTMEGLKLIIAAHVGRGEQEIFEGLFVGAKCAPAMDEGDLLGDAQETVGPVQGGVSASDNQNSPVSEQFQILDIVVDPFSLHALDVGDVKGTRDKGAHACGNDHRAGEVDVAWLGLHFQQASGVLDKPGHFFVQADPGGKFHGLFYLTIDKFAGQDLGEPRNVVDVFVGVEGGQLAAKLGEAIYDLGRGGAQARIEGSKQT